MRTFRWMLACAALVPAVASAQADRDFRNSWFWGGKAGVMTFSTMTTKNKVAPLVGGEWLITRKRFGLYLAYDHAIFDATAGIADMGGNVYGVNIRNLRRISAAGLMFPKTFGVLRPYAGLGASLNLVSSAASMDQFANSGDQQILNDEIIDRKERASFLVMGGVQTQYKRVAPFGQVTLQPSQQRFLLGERPLFILEGGVRINLGSAIERPE
jgi:opacity protein-like surface antigen